MRHPAVFVHAANLAAVTVLSAGCLVGPNYTRPDLSVPQQYRFVEGAQAETLADAPWFTVFEDPALQALARVPGVALLVRGDGPERPALEREAARLGVSDRVRFLGAGTRDDVLMLFRGADAVLVTSAWENLPHTVLEALAVGTPVVATAVGGIPELVEHGRTGLLCPPRDPVALAGIVVELLQDRDRALSLTRAAADRLEKHFTHHAMVEGTLRVYGEVLARRSEKFRSAAP